MKRSDAARPASPSSGDTVNSSLDRLYRIGLWIKGIDGALEMAGGLFLLFVSQTRLGQLVTFLTQRELAEDPHVGIACIAGPWWGKESDWPRWIPGQSCGLGHCARRAHAPTPAGRSHQASPRRGR